jgi:hypothetical protein
MDSRIFAFIRGKFFLSALISANLRLARFGYLLIADCFFRAMLLKSLLQPRGNRHGIARLNIVALHHVHKFPVAQ